MKAERRTDLRGRDYFWMGFTARRPVVADGTDLAAVLGGRISVTPLHIDLTHMPTVHALKRRVGRCVPPKLPDEPMTEPARQADTHETQLARLVLARCVRRA